MAFPSSGLFVPTFVSALNGTIVLDLDVLTHKVALYTNAMTTADLTTDTAYNVGAWATANEVTGTGYTAGGYTLANTTFTHTTAGVVVWDNTVDPNWTTATITARGALYYADALAGNNAIVAQTFGADITSTAGTFTIALAAPASGAIFSIDFVP
tara:strand:+ start:225 stop:689 length:465 start_codon:yes stop_codon:yes gene_type:complete